MAGVPVVGVPVSAGFLAALSIQCQTTMVDLWKLRFQTLQIGVDPGHQMRIEQKGIPQTGTHLHKGDGKIGRSFARSLLRLSSFYIALGAGSLRG